MDREEDVDTISIQEIDSNGNQKMVVAYLSGLDDGPFTDTSRKSNWVKKIISIPTNKMNIEFKTQSRNMFKGFSANIHYTPIQNMECESWLDMYKKIFKSPKYPQTYSNVIKCRWLITIDHDYHLTLDFTEFYVRYKIIKITF